ncbi:MAG: hypothetical protein OXJ52_03015 [Oligoflexia bacterium]|nr:hypothetical protein [Oligoflexia bacterium]
MNSLTYDSIAIDTNVFEHLMNKKYNKNEHISKLLKRFEKKNTSLLVDSKGEIRKEYSRRLLKYIKSAKENELRILLMIFYDLL